MDRGTVDPQEYVGVTAAVRLMLIRHSIPEIDTSVPAAEWELSDAGRQRARELAAELADRNISEFISSVEPKSVATAREMAAVLDIGWSTAPGLHEHERERMRWHGDEDWQALLRDFFNHPDNLVFGKETAHQALERFSRAIDAALETIDFSRGSVGIVSHGTVMSLFAGKKLGVDPYSIWSKLKLPDYVELDYALSN